MKLSQILYVLLSIGATLFAILTGLTLWKWNVKPVEGTLLFTYLADIQQGLAWILGIGTTLTGGTHFISYVWSQFQSQNTAKTEPTVAPQPVVQPEKPE